MLYMPKTRIRESYEWPVYSGASTLYEGQCLVSVMTAGIAQVTQSAGTTGDTNFAGVSLNVWQVPTTAKWVDTITVPSVSPYTATLSNAPVSPGSTTMSAVTSAGSALTYNSGVGSGQYTITNSTTITFNVAQAGNTYLVTYTYTMSTQQAISYYGQGDVLKLSPSQITNTVGVIRGGLIYTDQFDASQNWYGAVNANANNTPSYISTGASGVFTIGGSGCTLPWVTVYEAPSVNYPWLGLYINL
jgi:hypothetical protein